MSEIPESMAARRSPAAAKTAVVAATAVALLLVAQLTGFDPLGDGPEPAYAAGEADLSAAIDREESARIQRLFSGMRSGVQVEASGEVVLVMPDDTVGDQHQLFLVELSSGLTLKLSHNVDIAPKIPLEVGDRVRFSGEYEWNEKGGVVHWTHRNTRGGSHPGGWVLHEGKRYQ